MAYPLEGHPLVDPRTGRVTPPWLAFFQQLATSAGAGGVALTGLSGEVTTPLGGGVQPATIAASAVTTTKIADANVTYAKIQDVSAASRLLGRGSSGAGDVQEITLGSGLTMTGTSLAASGGGSGNVTDATAFGSEPGSPSDGDLDLYTNAPQLARYDGAAWAPWGPIWALAAPVDGDFSWVNQGSAAVSATNGGIYLSTPGAAGENLRMRVKTQPSPPYTLTVAYIPNLLGINYHQAGILFRESGTSKVRTFGLSYNSAMLVRVYGFTNSTTYSGFNSAISTFQTFPTLLWLRLTNDGATLTYSYSLDGFNYRTVLSEAVTAGFTTAPDQIGFMLNTGGDTANTIGMLLLSWLEA